VEVYRRMNERSGIHYQHMSWQDMSVSHAVRDAVEMYRPLLPTDKKAAILDIGFGSGVFIAACIKLGYTNIHGAEFGVEGRKYLYDWSPSVCALDEISSSIGDYLADKAESFDVIHMSHVIEHLPKYSLLYHVDAIYQALKVEGRVILRCPNMDSPYANSMLYCVLGHEYGFRDNNMKQLLHICQFDDVTFHNPVEVLSMKQRLGNMFRRGLIFLEKLKRRMFMTDPGEYRGEELIVSAFRKYREPLFGRSAALNRELKDA